MGRQTRKIEDEAIKHELELEHRLQSHKYKNSNISNKFQIPSIIFRYDNYMIRDISDWKWTKKSKNKDKIIIDLCKFLFEKYIVPSFIRNEFVNYIIRNSDMRMPQDSPTIVSLYFCVASGKSVYKNITKKFLSKKETHYFLNAPENIDYRSAYWWAIFHQYEGSKTQKSRIFYSKFCWSEVNEFNRSIARLFLSSDIDHRKMDDLTDYIHNMRRENNHYSLKGRSYRSLKRQMDEWHRSLRKQKYLIDVKWEAFGFNKNAIESGKKDDKTYWKFTEINEGKDLHREGQAMRHCVTSYRHLCVSGQCSIISLRKRHCKDVDYSRALTIEVRKKDNIYTVVQVRGFANRLMRPVEKSVVMKWASINNVEISNYV